MGIPSLKLLFAKCVQYIEIKAFWNQGKPALAQLDL